MTVSSLVQLVRIVGSHPTDPGSNPGRGRHESALMAERSQSGAPNRTIRVQILTVAQLVERGTVIALHTADIPRSLVRFRSVREKVAAWPSG